MFASAFVSDSTVRDALIKSIHNHANSNLSLGAFPEIYNTSDNSYKNGAAGSAYLVFRSIVTTDTYSSVPHLVACSHTWHSRKSKLLVKRSSSEHDLS